ncbi:MAG: DMT family transporter [Alkalinema sp. RU_4_3]|nr:DMT family transporter [Alkalinema sp. RU_4_3]
MGMGAALMAACLWAFASIVYGRLGQVLSPLWLNLLKGGMAIAMLLVSACCLGQPWPQIPGLNLLMLLGSGAFGIGLGDTAYFGAINRLGARRCLLLKALSPAVGSLLSWLWLQEALSGLAILGMAITIFGITWVVSERSREPGRSNVDAIGLGLGLAAAVLEGLGAVLAHGALIQSGVDPLWSATIRLVGGMAIVVPLLLYETGSAPQEKKPWPKLLLIIAVASFFSTFLGLWLQQIALKYSPTGIAQTLGATSPLFVLPMARLMGERLSGRAILGAVVALIGVAILVLYSPHE